MKSFNSKIKDSAYLFYRLVSPIIDPIHTYSGVVGYPRFLKDILSYKRKQPESSIKIQNLYPIFSDRLSITPFDAHYFFQGIWLLKHLLKNKPTKHIDVGSKYELSGYISLITKSEFVDIRPINTHLKNLSVVRGDILHLPYLNNSLLSVSSLHVVEHIGLGRYGDSINPDGTILACKELSRVLKPGGTLYLSLPIGKPRICFNAHRIHNPLDITEYCSDLQLKTFSVVTDSGEFIEDTKPERYAAATYSCGMYMFQKPRK